MEKITQENWNIFLLNNILMSVQFFENYERDIKLLRKSWFKEVLLESHYKKCFHADSLFRLSGAKVKFSLRNGINKNSETPLHPFRIYITSDNIEAAYDPSALGHTKLNVWPQYQFTVRTKEKNEKSGCISLVEFKTIEAPNKSPKTKSNFCFNETTETETNSNSAYFQRKSVIEEKYNRRLRKIEKIELNQNTLEKRNSLKQFTNIIEGIIPLKGFYKFQNSEERLKPESIQEFRMKSSPNTSHEIPQECFQREEIIKKLNFRRELNGCLENKKVLNSAAFKGYFCDLLIEILYESLGLHFDDVNKSSILEEFIRVNQKGVEYCITPAISIKDCNNYVAFKKKFQNSGKAKKLEWPSKQMKKIINNLPCFAVPSGYNHASEENLDYEKTWKLVFPKVEEFLLLHMMHAHIRCYFFVLLIYKSFLENEINEASFGPKHLVHLLFWKVHKNFLAWPEDRPGETLLTYLKSLYKKIQNQSLCDFFIISRNLFDSSLSKDLHKAQALIKKIIENPVPYIVRAIRNLHFESNFYPAFDVLQLKNALITVSAPEKSKKNKKQKMVRFQDEEKHLIKSLSKQVELERKAEEQEQNRRQSIESINIEEFLNFNPENWEKCNQILKTFTCHFIEMASKSVEFKIFSQALFYLHQAQKLLELIISKESNQDFIKIKREKINNLREICYSKLNQDFNKFPSKEEYGKRIGKAEENSKNYQNETVVKEKLEEETTKQHINEKEKETLSFDDESIDNEVFSVKL